MREDIVTLNLKYASSSESLVVLAYEELVKKILVFNAPEQDLTTLANNISSALGVRSINKEILALSVTNLLSQKKLINNKSMYSLQKEQKTQISEETTQQDKEKNRVLKNFFPVEIPNSKLRSWFNEAVVAFFGQYSDDVISSLTQTNKVKVSQTMPISDILEPSIASTKLEQYSQELVSGFENFVLSTKFDDTSYVTSLALALFSARLVAANISADPIAIKELHSAHFILDTNVLITFAVGRGIDRKTLENLGEAFATLDSDLYYLPPTRTEYLTSIDYHKKQILELVNKFPAEVINKAKDDFIQALSYQDITDEKGVINYFDSLVEEFPPALKSAPKITQLTDKEIQLTLENAHKNKKLQNDLISISKETSAYHPKSTSSALHDTQILEVAKSLRAQGENIWVLTLDRALVIYSERSTPEGQKPIILSLDALLGLLAIREAGTAVSGQKYGKLLAQMIRNRCIPSRQTYTPEDLQYLASISKQSLELTPKDIERIAGTVFRQQNSKTGVISSTIRLEVDRAFRVSLGSESEKSNKLSKKLKESDIQLDLEKQKNLRLKNALISDAKRTLRLKDISILVGWLILILIGFVLTAFVIIRALSSTDDRYNFFMNLLFGILGSSTIAWLPIKNYTKKKKTRQRRAESKVRKEIKWSK